MRRSIRTLAAVVLATGLVPAWTAAQTIKLKTPEEIRRERERAHRLFGQVEMAQIPPPDDVAAPPPGAIRTDSGLALLVLDPGPDGPTPGPNAKALVHYTGWTADGVTIDTTLEPEPAPREMLLRRTIDGFREALMMMRAGQKARIWVPEALAYPEGTMNPKGQLTFDVELVSFEPGPLPPADVAAVPDDAVVTESGLAYRVLQRGAGARPGPRDMVVAHFDVWRTDGTLLDTTRRDREPAHFQLDRTLPGFAEALPMMVPGDRWRLWLPEELARAEDTTEVDPLTVIDIELIRSMPPPERPVDLSRPPVDAERTLTGLAYKILRPGSGSRKPAYGETIEVIYAGWTGDGERFDSSYDHGAHGVFKIDDRKPLGWNEAVMDMVEGESRVVWIPEELAYGGQEGRPKGPLTFTIELVAIRD